MEAREGRRVDGTRTTGDHGMNADRKSIKVTIFGSEYPLRGDSEEFTKRVAVYVDDMITSIHNKLPDQPTLTVAAPTRYSRIRSQPMIQATSSPSVA